MGAATPSPAKRLDGLMTTAKAAKAITGVPDAPWSRLLYGDHDAGVRRDTSGVSFWNNAMWTVDPLGWNGLSNDHIANRVQANHGDGSIHRLHAGSGSPDGPVLPGIIDGLRTKGHAFGAVPQVVG